MIKFVVCPSCEGRGASSAYLGAFTSDDIDQMDPEFMEDYFAGSFDRTCTDCKGRNVVPECAQDGCTEARAFVEGYFGNTEGKGCFDHDDDVQSACETEAESAAERRFGC